MRASIELNWLEGGTRGRMLCECRGHGIEVPVSTKFEEFIVCLRSY